MNKEYDAIYIHGQGYTHREGRNVEPSIRGRLQASALKSLLERGYSFDKYLFSGFIFKGEAVSSADLNASYVKRRVGLGEAELIIDPTARTTFMEVSFAKKQAAQNGWKRVAHLTYGEVHPNHVRQLVKRQYGEKVEVDIFRADELLAAPESIITPRQKREMERYKKFIADYNNSVTEQKLLDYERKKDYFMNWPFDLGNGLLNLASKFHRPDPANNLS